MLHVQKGLVKYKDRSDIICTYGTTDDGKSYYFLDGEKLSNGNIIASSVLVEAIDPLAVASNVGIIDKDGNVVVAFENKSIKIVADKILLVEKSQPTTQSVIDASVARKDPLAATKLVTTSAAIKDKMYTKMGSTGRFVFNDQFSEVAVCDLDGKNLFDNRYFSFVGINNGILYLSDNTVESEIVEYYLNGKKEDNRQEEIDISSVVVDTNIVDKAMSQEEVKEDTDTILEKEESSLVENNIKPVVADKIEVEPDFPDKTMELTERQVTEIKVEESKDLEKFSLIDEKEEITDSDNIVEAEKTDTVNVDSFLNEESLSDDSSEKFDLFSNTLSDETISLDNKPSMSREEFFSSRIDDMNFNSDAIDDSEEEGGDTLFEDATSVMSRMINQLEEQRKVMNLYEEKLRKLNDFRKRAFDENKRLVTRYEALYEECKSLRNVVDEQKRIIDSQKEDIHSLKAQVAKKNDFAKLLVRAQSLLDDELQENKVYSKVM